MTDHIPDKTDYTMEELEKMIHMYEETSSGLTSALQLVDVTHDMRFTNDSTDASDILREDA